MSHWNWIWSWKSRFQKEIYAKKNCKRIKFPHISTWHNFLSFFNAFRVEFRCYNQNHHLNNEVKLKWNRKIYFSSFKRVRQSSWSIIMRNELNEQNEWTNERTMKKKIAACMYMWFGLNYVWLIVFTRSTLDVNFHEWTIFF